MHDPADKDPAGLGEHFQTRSDVDAAAINVASIPMMSPTLIPMRNLMR
jgi:hypothetical protein